MKHLPIVGKLYHSSGYFMLYPSIKIATDVLWRKDMDYVDIYSTSAHRDCLPSQVEWSVHILKKYLNCQIQYINPDSITMVLEHSPDYLYVKVLSENKIGWLIYLEEDLEEICLK